MRRIPDRYAVFLSHFDGADASTTFVEETGKALTANGNAQLDTAQSKFGGASLLLDGTGDYVTALDSADWYMGTGNFTIDCWVRFAALPGAAAEMDICGQYVDANNFWHLMYYNYGGTYGWIFEVYSAGTRTVFVAATAGAAISTATWYHIAIVRNGNNWVLYQGGSALSGSSTTDTDPIPDLASVLYVGSKNASVGFLNGWIEEMRIMKGLAGWVTSFTPPAKPYAPAFPIQVN